MEIVIGDEKLKGTNILAFVDLSQSRVAYIGFARRADIYDQLPPENYSNMSIAETGYRVGQILTGEQRAKAIKIALDNKTVQEKMNGKNYTVAGDVIVCECRYIQGRQFLCRGISLYQLYGRDVHI